jgi:hypothetical protein
VNRDDLFIALADVYWSPIKPKFAPSSSFAEKMHAADWVRAVANEDELPMSPDILVRVIHGLIEGLLFQRFLTPELVPDEVFYAAFAAIAGVRRSA